MTESHIDTKILPDELFIRGMLHPMHVKGKQLTPHRSLFLPRNETTDVSLYRHRYASFDKCKQAALLLGGNSKNKYWGLASFHLTHVDYANNLELGIKATIIGSPMDDSNNYITDRIPLINEPGLPFHADLRYESAYRSIESHEPSTPHRKYADTLLELSRKCQDPDIENDAWVGESLIF